MTVPTSRFVRANGANLHFADWGGEGDKPTLLLLHGDMRTSRSWDAVARELRGEFHIIALDMRGHGDSDWTESGYTFAHRTDDLEAFADAVGLRGVATAAHSTGGVVATLLSERRPDIFSRLALLEPMVVVTESFQRMVSKRAETPRRTWANRAEMRDYLKWHRMTGEWRDDVIEDVVAHESYARADGRIDMKWATASMAWKEREGDYPDIRPALRTLGKPILFIMSDSRAGAFADAARIAAQTADFETLAIADSGHNMYMDQPTAVASAISRFAGAGAARAG